MVEPFGRFAVPMVRYFPVRAAREKVRDVWVHALDGFVLLRPVSFR
jgi:hypothetical protein